MNRYLKYAIIILILFAVTSASVLIISRLTDDVIRVLPGTSLALTFAVTTYLSLAVFFRGLSREPRSHTMHTFVATSAKFIIELFTALFFFVVAKNNTPEYIVLFFVLYLTFSIFELIVILKALKKKPL